MGGHGALFSATVWGRADWMTRITSIVKFVMRTFVLHISIASPLGESGKLQMASDMTGLEFALNAFIVDGTQSKRGGNLESIGDEYRALRAMRWVDLCFRLGCKVHTKQKAAILPREQRARLEQPHHWTATSRGPASRSGPFADSVTT